jgi:hypothetical protein
VLLAHLLAPAGQRHSVHKNEYEDHIFFFTRDIATDIIVEVVEYNLDISLLDFPRYYCQYCD